MSRFQRPKTLYFYTHHRLEKHEITDKCSPEVVANEPTGIRFRCRTDRHDFYGYAKQKEAKLYEIQQTKVRIYDEQNWLKKLTGVDPDCPHTTTVQDGDGHRCVRCKQRVSGWWCPKSPDHCCYYFSEEKNGERVVVLKDGLEVQLPKGHNHENETDDSCLFCGAPDERK